MKRVVVVVGWVIVAGGCGSTDACFPGQEPTWEPTARNGRIGYLGGAHAHNDYLHNHPLEDALAQGFHSVEADVWLPGGTLQVAHWPWEGFTGTLQELYLDPLQKLVDDNGSVLGDGEPFVLWLDIKERNPAYVRVLRDVLDGYPMLTVFHSNRVEERPVTVLLTGDSVIKEAVVNTDTPVRAARDSNDFRPDDPVADTHWRAYALDWKAMVGWNGNGAMDDDARRQLGCIMENAHRGGRQVRFYNHPDRAEIWRVQLAAGADFINADDLQALASFLRSAP